MDFQISDTEPYDKAINEIGLIINKYELTYVEAFGVLECVKTNLIIKYDGEE